MVPALPLCRGMQCTVGVFLRVLQPWLLVHTEYLPLALEVALRSLELGDVPSDEPFPMNVQACQGEGGNHFNHEAHSRAVLFE